MKTEHSSVYERPCLVIEAHDLEQHSAARILISADRAEAWRDDYAPFDMYIVRLPGEGTESLYSAEDLLTELELRQRLLSRWQHSLWSHLMLFVRALPVEGISYAISGGTALELAVPRKKVSIELLVHPSRQMKVERAARSWGFELESTGERRWEYSQVDGKTGVTVRLILRTTTGIKDPEWKRREPIECHGCKTWILAAND